MRIAAVPLAAIAALFSGSACFSPPSNPGGTLGSSGRATASGTTAGSTSTASTSTSTGGSTLGTFATSGRSSTGSVGANSSGASTGSITTNGASNTNGGTATTGTATATASTSSGAGTSSGSTGGSCSATEPCPGDGICELSLTACTENPFDELSNGGVCVPPPACASSPNGCENQSCQSDNDCDTFESCQGGVCEGFACPGLGVACSSACSPYSEPHTCNQVCVCPSCSSSDAGSPNLPCDLSNPCPIGDDCIYNTSPCPYVAGTGEPTLDLGGTCSPQVVCPGGSCEGMACNADSDCSDDEACTNGTCEPLECPPLPAECFAPGCTTASEPHSCAPYCLCTSCPNPEPDGGSCTCPFGGNVPGFQCCGATCVDTENDTENCNGCGLRCGSGQVCQNGACTAASCDNVDGCADVDGGTGPATCCGSECCGGGSICCLVEDGPEYMGCFAIDAGCPIGCPICA